MSNTTIHYGGCLCKGVRFKVSGDPFTFFVCHCKNCQNFTGTAFMSNIFFKAKNFEVTSGQEYIKEYEDTVTETGDPLTRRFCSQCGSSLPFRPVNKAVIIVPCGTLDDASDLVPRVENFKDTKWSWVKDIAVKPHPKKAAKL